MTEIATLDAVKNGEFYCTIRKEARGTDLQGAYCTFVLNGGNNRQKVLARIGSVDMTNPVHENPLYAPVRMVKGRIPHFSGDADVESTKLDTVAVIDIDTGQYAPRRSNPSSGTPVMALEKNELKEFARESEHYAVIGTLPNDHNTLVAIRNRHFGDYGSGGEGEARHSLPSGQNGSGKTVMALTQVAVKVCAHHSMGLFCPDTAGDISTRGRHHRGDFKFDFYELLERAGRSYQLIDIADVRLKDKTTLKRLLAKEIIVHLSASVDKAESLAGRVVESLFDDGVDEKQLTADAILDAIIDNIAGCYSKNAQKEKRDNAIELKDNPGRYRPFARGFDYNIRKFFIGNTPIGSLIHGFLNRGEIVILKMESLKEDEQQFIMYEIFKTITWMAEDRFKKGGTCNAMILLDEGPRWVRDGDSDDPIAKLIRDAFNTTRKQGVGWTVITQRLADIHKTVLAQAHNKYFGRGLGVGADAEHMRRALGENGLATYRHLELQGGYFWLGIGMDANIGTESSFYSFRPFDGDSTQRLIEANPHIWRPTL